MMRIAYVAGHLPRRRELASGPIDAEWVIEARGRIEVVVFADYESEGTALVRESGGTVHVSPKRPVPLSGGGYRTAEEAQAGILLDLHVASPFDAVVYDPSQGDWAWHQPRLGSIPRGIALGAGPMRDIRIVTSAPGLFRSHGRALWSLTGPLRSADFLLGDAPPEAYGLRASGLPPRLGLAEPPRTPPSPGPFDFLAVVALSEDASGLATIVPRALERVEAHEGTVVAVIHPDIPTGAETTRDIVLTGLPDRLLGRLRMAEPSSDGIANGLLAQADVVVAARPSDLAVRAVGDTARRVGAVVLEETPGPMAPLLDGSSPAKRAHPPPRLVPADRSLEELASLIDGLPDTTAAVVLHSRASGAAAERLWQLPGSSAGGLLLVCDTGPYLGEADPARPAFDLLGFGMDSWPSVRRLMHRVGTLHEMVEAAADSSHAHRTDLSVLPITGASHGRLPQAGRALPAWVTDTGSLPAPEPSGTAPAPPAATRETGTGYRHAPGEATVKQWAETHGFRDRVRLALPWKWGLLNRAMRDRW